MYFVNFALWIDDFLFKHVGFTTFNTFFKRKNLSRRELAIQAQFQDFQCWKKYFALWIDKFFRWFFCLILKYVWIRVWMYSTKISSYCRYIRYILWLTIVTTFLFIFKANWNSSVVHEWWGCSPLQFNYWPNVIGIGQAKQYFPW